MPLTVFRGPYSALIQLRYPGNSSDVSLSLEHRVDIGQGCEEVVSDDEGVSLSPAEAACCLWWLDPLGPATVLGQGSTFPGCPELASPLVQDLEMSLAVPP